MRHLSALIGLLTLTAFTVSGMFAQKIHKQPRVIGDTKLAGCVNHLGQNMVQNGAVKVPITPER
jgi:hypothetical protein